MSATGLGPGAVYILRTLYFSYGYAQLSVHLAAELRTIRSRYILEKATHKRVKIHSFVSSRPQYQ